jgi:hypothetical protein
VRGGVRTLLSFDRSIRLARRSAARSARGIPLSALHESSTSASGSRLPLIASGAEELRPSAWAVMVVTVPATPITSVARERPTVAVAMSRAAFSVPVITSTGTPRIGRTASVNSAQLAASRAAEVATKRMRSAPCPRHNSPEVRAAARVRLSAAWLRRPHLVGEIA